MLNERQIGSASIGQSGEASEVMGLDLETRSGGWRQRIFCRSLLGILLLVAAPRWRAEEVGSGEGVPREPHLISMFPIGGRSGTAIELELQGQTLEGAYAIWSSNQGIRGRIREAEQFEVRLSPTNVEEVGVLQKRWRLQCEVEIGSGVSEG